MSEPKKVIAIRRATQQDASNLFRLRGELLSESGWGFVPIDDDRLMMWIAHTIGNGFVGVADLDGRIVGSVALQPAVPPWSASPILETVWLFVRREFRARGTAAHLLMAAEAFAKDRNLPFVVNIHARSKLELKEQFIQGRGYTYLGGTFLKRRD